MKKILLLLILALSSCAVRVSGPGVAVGVPTVTLHSDVFVAGYGYRFWNPYTQVYVYHPQRRPIVVRRPRGNTVVVRKKHHRGRKTNRGRTATVRDSKGRKRGSVTVRKN